MIGALIFGLVAGVIAKAIMPGKDPGGIIVTILLGIAGSMVGYWLFRAIGIGDDDAFDVLGLPGAVIGTLLLLWGYRKVIEGREPRGALRS